MSLLFIFKLIVLFFIVYAVIKNLKTLLKAAIVIFVVLMLLGFIGFWTTSPWRRRGFLEFCFYYSIVYWVLSRQSPGHHRLSMFMAALTSRSSFSPHFGQIQSRVFTSKFSFMWLHLWHFLLVFLASTNTTPSASGLYHLNFFCNLFMNLDNGKIMFCSPPMRILILE